MASEGDNKSWEYPEPHPAEPSTPGNARDQVSEAAQEILHPVTTPPRTRVADDLLLLFGRLAAAVLFSVTLLTAAVALIQPEKDLSGVYGLLNTQLSLIIGAVLGYAAHPVEKER